MTGDAAEAASQIVTGDLYCPRCQKAVKDPLTCGDYLLHHLPPMRNGARRAGRRTGHRLAVLAVASLLLISCRTPSTSPSSKAPSSGSSKSPTPAIGIAFTGPTAVNLREDLGPRANVVSTLQHGERLEVLEMRRRFVRVRTSKGLEGWTDVNYLLSQQQVGDLDKLAEFASKLSFARQRHDLRFPECPHCAEPPSTQLHADPRGRRIRGAAASSVAARRGDAAGGRPAQEE